MADTFQIITGFLERFGDEVEGRELQEPTSDDKERLSQLARGDLPESKRAEMLVQLNRNPAWITWLAQEVKTLRSPDK